MTYLFLDIETVPEFASGEEYLRVEERIKSGELNRNSPERDLYWKFKKGGLDPFRGKVILITYRVNEAYTHRLKEWEEGEAAILGRLYSLLKSLQSGQGDDWLHIIGHNILGFDLFFLYERMRLHRIDEPEWIHHYLIKRPDVIDLLQIHLPPNAMQRRGLKHDVLADAYGLPTKGDDGGDQIGHYYRAEYGRILEYSEREFVYAEIYDRVLTGGLVPAGELADAVQRYNEVHDAGKA